MELMELALSGDKDSARLFLELFLASNIFVPDRYQSSEIAGAPAYPNDLIWVMGLQDSDRVIVPAFTDPSMIDVWAGGSLSFRSPTGQSLLDAIPEGWWLWLNPGFDVEKEFSPWEISELRRGPGSFDVVLSEIFPEEIVEPLSVSPIPETEYQSLKEALKAFALAAPAVRKIFLLREEGKDFEGSIKTQLLIGIEADVLNSDEADSLREAAHSSVATHQIGADPIRVMVGRDAKDGLYLSLFKGVEPIYSRPALSVLGHAAKKLRAFFKGHP